MNCLSVDLARPWASSLIATDAAPAFGFGMARASCSPSVVRSVAAHCSMDGRGIILAGADLDSASVRRTVRAPLHLPIHYDDFAPQFSVKAKSVADAPTLEATAVTGG